MPLIGAAFCKLYRPNVPLRRQSHRLFTDAMTQSNKRTKERTSPNEQMIERWNENSGRLIHTTFVVTSMYDDSRK